MAADKIMIVRHGEKQLVTPPPFSVNEDGDQDKHSLSVRGWQRAGALVPFFRLPWVAGIVQPTCLFASRVAADAATDPSLTVDGEDVTKSLRPQETLTPLARALDVRLNIPWGVGEEQQLAATVVAAGGTVLVAWEHKHIPVIAGIISDDAPSAWPSGGTFDLVWIFDRLAGTEKYSFKQVQQDVLDGDTPPAP